MSLQHQLNSHGPQIIIRAAIVALLLGGLLTLINQWGALFGYQSLDQLAMAQVFATPFLVVVVSQILGLRAARRSKAWLETTTESLVVTMFSHGIPARAILIGFAAVSSNAAIAATHAYLAGRGLDQVSLVLLSQALVLPILFGAVSQALTIRRALAITASARTL
ncbi:MAG: hypothetical protein GY948_15130 [Alphaproteobacteria bacterium]|nr:hypothetical protein [Alphaproteobacteria bacterium]